MATVNEMFDETQNETSFYVPDSGNSSGGKTGWTPTKEGKYLGHIENVETRIVEFQNYKARVYNFKFKVAKENSNMKYIHEEINGENVEIDGSAFVGRIFRSSGIFRFLEPGKDDKFSSNPTGNRGYLSLCQAIGTECKEIETKIDGKKVKVKELPSLNTSDVEGMPVEAMVKAGKAYTDKNVNKRNYFDVKWVNPWTDGKRMKTGVNDDIPF